MTENKDDLISREALKEAVINNFDNLQAYFPKDFIEEIDNAPTVHHPNCDICEDKAKSYSMGFQDGYLTGKERPQGEWLRKEDVIHHIAKQYSEHNEIVPIWLSIADMRGEEK